MSDNSDFLATIEFRDFVANFAEQLAAEEVYEVAYVWLQKRGDVEKFSPSCCDKQKACGLELFAKLECSGVFSRKDVSRLREIAKRINRTDLVKSVDAYAKETKKKRKTNETKCTKKKDSEERQELENTFETLVVQMAVLEQHISLLQKMLCQQKTDVELRDEGLEIIEHSSEIAQKLALKLSQVHKNLASRSRTNSSSSGSSDSNSSRLGNGVVSLESVPSPALSKIPPPPESQVRAVKPTPKPRTRIGQSFPTPIQESAGQSAHHSSASPQHAKLTPLPRPRRKTENTGSPSPDEPSSPSASSDVSVQEVRQEEDDGTGDSGMETGSGSAYCNPQFWKNIISVPPPDKKTATRIYMSLKEETRDKDLPYQVMEFHKDT